MPGCLKFWLPAAVATLIASSACASDLPAPAAAVPAPAASWTGFYLGVHGGMGQASTEWERGAFGPYERIYQNAAVEGNAGAALVGGQIGYNRQFGNVVLGAELDITAGQLHSATRCLDYWLLKCQADTDVMGTLTGRLGYAFGNVLAYGKAGLALADVDLTIPFPALPGGLTRSSTMTGWTVGAGLEFALTPSLSAKAEYDYMDFGSRTMSFETEYGPGYADLNQTAQVVKLGINWRPDAAPLPGTVAQPSAPTRDWSGLYVGGHGGGAWAREDWTSATGTLAAYSQGGIFEGDASAQGLFGGGQVGFNVQAGNWVAGVEASISAADIEGSAKCATTAGRTSSFRCIDDISSFGLLTGRLGYGTGNVLVYGKGGAAWADADSTVQPTSYTESSHGSETRWGWMLGAGVEYALDNRLSAFVEYNHIDFGTSELSFTGSAGTSTASFDQSIDAIRLGLNYRLGGADGGSSRSAVAGGVTLPPVGWSAEIGARYFLSTGRMQKDLYNEAPTPDRVVSRLIYADTTGQAGETFFRFDNDGGLFVKGFAGLGALSGGQLNDEDFPAGPVYSNTVSSLDNGNLSYGAVDVGYDLLDTRRGSLGAFVGYRALYQAVNGYGCAQVAQSTVCNEEELAQTPAIADNLVLSETELWQGVALGLNSRLRLSDRMTLEVDAAYLPYVTRTGHDNHWLRADINPMPETGDGWGTQIEAVLTYAVNDRFDIGIGGRYWYFATDNGQARFPTQMEPQSLTFYSERYGAFLQAAYRFGDDRPPLEPADLPAKAAEPKMNWTGLYLGGTLGAGRGETSYNSPFATPVSGDAADLGGALAGGQIGFDYQFGDVVLGAEFAGSWADILGTDTCYSTAPAGSLAGFNCGSRVTGLMSATARLGYAFDRSLLYLRGGYAWDRQTDSFNNENFVGAILENGSTNGGWTLGGGIEYALMPNLSVGLDYRHYAFDGSSAFHTSAPASLQGVNLAPDSTRLDTVAMTLNWRFGAASAAR
ncbi:outer membrane beta-barrel protein [Ancylobacter sp. Lp-2]|uniref:outer membrane protein n=1 Tax=Ancylobacter sp. Lp-2 TaxID=2881339 RepID=UPI001E4FFFDF|nr:outer membrane beta-barrel protein [Ancylobacter sp. Lp-2]